MVAGEEGTSEVYMAELHFLERDLEQYNFSVHLKKDRIVKKFGCEYNIEVSEHS